MRHRSTHVASYLQAVAGSAPDHVLWHCESRSVTAAEAAARVAALAAALAARLRLAPGDRLATAAGVSDRHFEALLAISVAGCVAAPLNTRWSGREAAAAAALLEPRALLADAACLPAALAACGAAGSCTASALPLVLLGDPASYSAADQLGGAAGSRLVVHFAEELIAEARRGAGPAPRLAPRSAPGGAAFIIFTSGTTGAAKGVVLSHAGLHAATEAKAAVCGYSSGDVYLHTAPLFHVGGLSSALAMLAVGARHAFLPRFDPEAMLRQITAQHVTAFIAVPTMVAELEAAAVRQGVTSLPSVRRVLVGGGGMTPALTGRLAGLLPQAELLTAYGMTEFTSSLTFSTLRGRSTAAAEAAAAAERAAAAEAPPAGAALVGRAAPGVELAVLPSAAAATDAAGSAAGAAGELPGGLAPASEGRGEVLARGPQLMLGYWRDGDATAAALLPGGWLRTGDLGVLRSGTLWLLGRVKDVIKSGGENVHAPEVESSLCSHPGVAAAAAVGVADWRLGEAVAAGVTLAPGWAWAGPACQTLLPGRQPSEQRHQGGRPPEVLAGNAAEQVLPPRTLDGRVLQLHCRRAGLAGFKLPRVLWCGALPANASGKVLKPQLRQAIEAAMLASDCGSRARL